MSKEEVYLPSWAKPNCKIIEEWDEDIQSGSAKGIRTRIKFLNSKGNEQTATKLVRWIEQGIK